jgi:hypothetical protein
MFSDVADGAPPVEWVAQPEPSGAEILLRTVVHRALSPREQLGAVQEALRTPRDTLRSAGETAGAMAKAAGALRPVGASSLTGPIGPHRVWRWASVRLSDVKAVRSALGGTVNDVVLTVITNGFRDLLESRGEEVPEDRVVRTMVPVSVRRPGEKGVYNNRVSAVFASLPVGLTDPAQRLTHIRAEMDGVKQSKQAVAGDVLTSLSGFAPPLLLALGSRVVTRSPRLNIHTATTNVPGPQHPVHTLGRRMLQSYPFVPSSGRSGSPAGSRPSPSPHDDHRHGDESEDAAQALPARDRGQDLDLLAVGDGRVEPVAEADVLAVDVDVDEPPQGAVAIGQAVAQLAVALEQRVEHRADGGALDADGALAPGGLAQLGRQLHLRHHTCTSAPSTSATNWS